MAQIHGSQIMTGSIDSSRIDNTIVAASGGLLSSSLDFGGHNAVNMADPVNDQDGATKYFVLQSITSGSDPVSIGAASEGLSASLNVVTINYASGSNLAAVDAGAAAMGTLPWIPKADHKHTVTVGTPGAIQVGATAASGSATSLALSDHVHSAVRGVPVNVGTANSAGTGSFFAAQDHVHAAPYLNSGNRYMAAEATVSDGDEACATGIAADNALGGDIQVVVNGTIADVGNGVKTRDCYFSADAGSTARAFSAVASGDKLYWNGSLAGYQLQTSFKISFIFNSF
jgi:hypothetical protein